MNNLYLNKKRFAIFCLLLTGLLSFNANSQTCTPVATLNEDFNSYNNGYPFPISCWAWVADPALSSSAFPLAYINEDTSVTPSEKAVALYSFTYTSRDFYLISPALSTINGNYHIKFDAKLFSALGTGSTLQIGTLDSNTNVANFTQVGSSFTPTLTNQTFTSLVIPATTGHQYVAIKFTPGGNHSTVLIDNIIWEAATSSVQSVAVTTQNNVPATITTANGTLQLEAAVLPSTVSQNVTWTVQSGTAFASVDNTGLVTAIANGTATIRATSVLDPTQYDEINVVVNTATPCTAVSSFYEDFDAPSLTCCNMGVVPDCWNSISTAAGANQIISTTSPASGTNNIYQFGYGANLQSIVVMPEVNNINAGTHQFRFKLRANSGPGDLDFGYITDITNASTFVIIQTINVTNSSYTDPTAERILTVPTTVPSNARLAIRNPGTSWAGFYWDDASWEPITSTAVQSVAVTTQNNVPAIITTANGTLQLEAAVLPSTVSQNVTWSVQSGTAFASVDNTGLVTAIADGTATIRATSVADTSVYGEITITVNTSSNPSCNAVTTIDEDFETFTTFPENCWISNKTAPMADLDANTTSGSQFISLYSYMTANDPIYLVTPELSTIDGNHLLEFDIVSTNAASSDIEVGTMTDNTDFSTFVPVGTSFNPTVGTHSSAYIPANAGHKYVAIKFTSNGVHQAVSIDNVKWTTTASAPKFDTSKVVVYPNPTTGIFNVETELDVKQIDVYNSLGQKVLTTCNRQINLQTAANGLYFVTVSTHDGAQASYKLIKK